MFVFFVADAENVCNKFAIIANQHIEYANERGSSEKDRKKS